jgi:UDP-sugar transporter A1/2/3
LQFVIGTAVVLFATYLYSGPERKRSRPSPINIASYEKTTIDKGYTPKHDEDRSRMQMPVVLDPLESIKAAGLSTSRPGSPMRHHSRVGSSRGKARHDD